MISQTSRSLAITLFGKGNLSKTVVKLEIDRLDYKKSQPRPSPLTMNLSSPPP